MESILVTVSVVFRKLLCFCYSSSHQLLLQMSVLQFVYVKEKKITYSLTVKQSRLKVYLQFIHIISHFPCFVVFFGVTLAQEFEQPYTHTSIQLFIYSFVCLFCVCLSVCLFACLFVYLLICLSNFLGHWKTCKTASFKSGNIAEMFAAMQAQAASAQDTITS